LTDVSIPAQHTKLQALARAALPADCLADEFELLRHALIGADDLVEDIGDLAGKTIEIVRQAHREIAVAHRLHCLKQDAHIERAGPAAIAVF
jgi:hypothetical protein